MNIKTCSTCKIEKNYDEFAKVLKNKDGYDYRCKSCKSIYYKKYSKTPEAISKNLAAVKRYQFTKNGRSKIEAYKATEKGIEAAKSASKLYEKSEHGMVKRKRANAKASESGRAFIYYQVRHKLKKQPCVKCGKFPAEAHHHDYSKPLDVTWLCRKHHAEEHKEIRGQIEY